MEALEEGLRRVAQKWAAHTLTQSLNADHSDHRGPRLACPCGGTARYAGRRAKIFPSTLGDLELERAYYHCPQCGTGFCPRDQDLGLSPLALSPGLARMIGLVGATVSFREGSELLEQLAGVKVEVKQVERVAEALGREMAVDERQQTEAIDSGSLPPTMYLGLDGTAVPMRPSAVARRKGKQEDGTAKSREAKLCTIWTAESRDERGRPVRDLGSVTYSAAIESVACVDHEPRGSPFALRVWREALRRRFPEVPRRVVLGDGAEWIWNQAEEQFPGAQQIVDLYHAKENLCKLSKALYGERPAAERWAARRHQEIEDGKFPALLRALRHHLPQEEARKALHYFQRNRERMRYPEFRTHGLCISSGVLEAGCKVAIGHRLKRSGMHWTETGANAIIALRCYKLSGHFPDFWERRTVARAA